MAPPATSVVPIGEELSIEGLKRRFEAEFYVSTTRPPCVYRGNPFVVEVGLAYGGDLPGDEPAEIMRFANRVPLQYQPKACAISESVYDTNWKSYKLPQPKGVAPAGPARDRRAPRERVGAVHERGEGSRRALRRAPPRDEARAAGVRAKARRAPPRARQSARASRSAGRSSSATSPRSPNAIGEILGADKEKIEKSFYKALPNFVKRRRARTTAESTPPPAARAPPARSRSGAAAPAAAPAKKTPSSRRSPRRRLAPPAAPQEEEARRAAHAPALRVEPWPPRKKPHPPRPAAATTKETDAKTLSKIQKLAPDISHGRPEGQRTPRSRSACARSRTSRSTRRSASSSSATRLSRASSSTRRWRASSCRHARRERLQDADRADKTISIRQMYYMPKHTLKGSNENTFEEQNESDPIIEDLEVATDALREELHLFANRKGAMVGKLVDQRRGRRDRSVAHRLAAAGRSRASASRAR